MFSSLRTFDDLRGWLARLPDQVAGKPSSICQTGERYIEIFQSALSRPDDVAAVEAEVVAMMEAQLTHYFERREGRIHWRIPLETEISAHEVVVKYDESGPDIDSLVARRCVKDKNWMSVKAYCRLYRATHPSPLDAPKVIAA